MQESTDKQNEHSPLRSTVQEIKREQRAPVHNERHRLIKKGEKTGDVYVDMFLEEEISPIAKEAVRILYTEHKRIYVEACLLASDDYDYISELLDIPKQVIETYCKVFFDIHEYDRVDKVKLIENEENNDGQVLKMWCFSQGLEFIAWRLGKPSKITPVDGLSSLYSDCYYKAKEAIYNPNSSDASKEGLKWAKQTTDIARLLKSWITDTDEAKKDIELALENLTGENTEFESQGNLEEGTDAQPPTKKEEDESFEVEEEGEVDKSVPEFSSIDDLENDDNDDTSDNNEDDS